MRSASREAVVGPPASSAAAEEKPVVAALAVSGNPDDHTALAHIFSHTNWRLHSAPGCADAFEFVRRHRIPVVLTASHLPDGSWRDLLDRLSALPSPPVLIVISRGMDERLWAEVLNIGGYDVLMTPFVRQEVVRVISLAWRFTKR